MLPCGLRCIMRSENGDVMLGPRHPGPPCSACVKTRTIPGCHTQAEPPRGAAPPAAPIRAGNEPRGFPGNGIEPVAQETFGRIGRQSRQSHPAIRQKNAGMNSVQENGEEKPKYCRYALCDTAPAPKHCRYALPQDPETPNICRYEFIPAIFWRPTRLRGVHTCKFLAITSREPARQVGPRLQPAPQQSGPGVWHGPADRLASRTMSRRTLL